MTVQAQEVIESFNQLETLCNALAIQVEALAAEGWQAWTIRGESELWSRADSGYPLAADIYRSLSYAQPGGSGRETWRVPGLLAVPEYVIESARVVNAAKSTFHALATAYRKLFAANEGREKLRELLTRSGRGRVHIKHCSRQIVLSDQPLKSISLSWVRAKRSIKKIDASECEAKLWKLDASGQKGGIDAQLNILHGLSPADQQRLRQVQDQTNPSVKGLLYLADGSKQHLGYLSMPALICNQGARKLPEFNRIPDAPPPGRPNRRRADARIGETPLLPAIRVFLIDE